MTDLTMCKPEYILEYPGRDEGNLPFNLIPQLNMQTFSSAPSQGRDGEEETV